MSVLDRVLGRQPQASLLENPQYALSSTGILDALHMGRSGHVLVNERTSLGMSAVWRSVNLIAGGSASLPLHPYKPNTVVDSLGQSAPVRQTSGQAADLLDQPHPDLTPFELWEIVYCHLLLWGNAYLQKVYDGSGVLRELWPLHPSRVTPGRASDGTKVYRVDGGGADERVLTDTKLLHIPGFGYDGVAGMSPIAAARKGIGLSLAAERFGADLFERGSLSGGILQTEQRLTQPKADALKDRWRAKVAGLDNAHDIVVLDNGAKFEKLTIPPDDAQFIESRSFQVEEIARLFGIPPHMLAATEKSTSWGTGIEQQSLGFVKYTLRPWLTRVEQRITRVLTPRPVYAKYSLEGLLRGDSVARKEFYTGMWGLGALSTNEIRALEELPPVDGGEVRYRPLNYGELGTTDSTAKEPTNAA